MKTRVMSFASLILGTVLCAAAATSSRPSGAGGAMAGAARNFLGTLTPDLRARAVLPFDGAARTDWHFVPRERPGLTFGEMNEAQRAAAHGLLRSALSSSGYLKVTGIVELETVLREMESSPARDPEKYTIAVYGDPGAGTPWGWKIEGHHVSLNFSSVSKEITTTPSFLGANPAEVRQGRRAGWRVLAAEEDLGRELVKSFDKAQLARAVISPTAPGDIILGPGRSLDEAKAAGLSWGDMNEGQRDLLWRLVREYAENLEHELGAAQLERITKAGKENIRFAWAGGSESGQGHYYRVQGPTFVLEYDNTQNNANHVHTVWHDMERDFGRDLLRDHYQDRRHDGRD